MAATETPQQLGNGAFCSYDSKALSNYAKMSAMCWPGFDTSSYAAAAYSQANALAAATLGQQTVSSSTTPPSMSALGTTLCLPAHSTTPSTPAKKPAQPVPTHMKDEHYWERRKRNNESARRSRESRRSKEEQIAVRVVYLEQENLSLRTEVGMLRAEIEKMRMIFSCPSQIGHH